MKFNIIVLFLVGTIVYGQRSDFTTSSFDKADSIALQNKGASLQNLPVLVHDLTSDLSTEAEKFRSIYTWVCTNIANDYGSYQKTVKKRKKLSENLDALTEWNDDYTPKVFEKLIKQRKTACTGYAFLVREMAKMADIKCSIVNGYGRTPTLVLNNNSIPNHSWNLVELDGKWYLCDPTWSAGHIVFKDDGPQFEPDYFDSYFLADPNLFIRNHYPLEIKSSLLEKPPTLEEFIEGPVVYKEAFFVGVFPTLPSKMHLEILKNEPVSFTFTSTESLTNTNFSLLQTNGTRSTVIAPEIIRNQNEYLLRHTFEKSGKYDVHIKMNEVIIATYVIKVSRN